MTASSVWGTAAAVGLASGLVGYYIGLGSTLGYTRRGTSSAKEDEGESDYETESEEDAADELRAVKAQGDEPCKLVLVVRSDLNMTKGKIAAQCSHATLACYKTLMRSNPKLVQHWERTGQAKIAVKCESEEELEILQASAKSLGVCARSIQDAGRTQVDPGTTTVLGIGPAPVRVVNHVTGHLKLLPSAVYRHNPSRSSLSRRWASVREKRSNASSDDSGSEDENEEDEEKLIGEPAASGARSIRSGGKKQRKQKKFWEMRSMDSGQAQPAQAGQSGNGMIICVIVTVVILVLLGVGGYFMYKQGMLSSIFPSSAASSSTSSPVAGATGGAAVPTAGAGMSDTAAITSNTDTAAASASSASDSSAASGLSYGANNTSASVSAAASGSESGGISESRSEHSGSKGKSVHEEKSKSGNKTGVPTGMPKVFTQTLVTTINGKATTQEGYWANDGGQGVGGTVFKSHWIPKPTNLERLRRRVGDGEPPVAQALLTTLLPVQTAGPS
ncbi:mitochondrial peptidyl-tRNA hydrolase [Rhodotorula toruloides]|uniref:peptidyl-tRNA hydrolase n=1 Tax=Rhodotorula toruloides TaxID=5286 RepID=A0A511KFR4_RHOTO|nr:mitochondrial peptidyl-tRNA hydrolase [Rhodotorula toruloides]